MGGKPRDAEVRHGTGMWRITQDGRVMDVSARPLAGGALEAGLLIVAARTSGGESDTSGITLFLVQGDARGVSRTALKTLDAHAAANISFANVEVGADAVLGTVDAGFATLEQILDRARIGLAAEALGAADSGRSHYSGPLESR